MYVGIAISVAVFASDIYTAVMLLAYDKWASEIDPAVPINISRWIFAGCIILSTILAFIEFMIGIRIYRGKNISRTYTNTIARQMYSIRGYSYFCLFGKITKSRSKTEYLALFVYFALKSWLKLIIADGPRQAINALTLYSVLQVNSSFIATVKEIATTSYTQALVIGVMLFSLTIWAINMIEFLFALLCTIPLYSHIRKSCSGLEEYCYVRINARIAKLVRKYHERDLIELKEANKRMSKQPTLPVMFMDSSATLIGHSSAKNDDDDDDLTPLKPNRSVPQAGSIYGNSTSTQESAVNHRKPIDPVFDPFEKNKRSFAREMHVNRKPVVRFQERAEAKRKPVTPIAEFSESEQLLSHTPKPKAPRSEPRIQQTPSALTPRPQTAEPTLQPNLKSKNAGDENIRARLYKPQDPQGPRAATAPVGRFGNDPVQRSITVPPGSQSTPTRGILKSTGPLSGQTQLKEQYPSVESLPTDSEHALLSHEDSSFHLNRQNSNATLYSTSSVTDLPTQPAEIINYNPPAQPEPVKELNRRPSRTFQVEANSHKLGTTPRGMYEKESEIIDYYHQGQGHHQVPNLQQFAPQQPNWYSPAPPARSMTAPATIIQPGQLGSQLLPSKLDGNSPLNAPRAPNFGDASIPIPPHKPAKIKLNGENGSSESMAREPRLPRFSTGSIDDYTPSPQVSNDRLHNDQSALTGANTDMNMQPTLPVIAIDLDAPPQELDLQPTIPKIDVDLDEPSRNPFRSAQSPQPSNQVGNLPYTNDDPFPHNHKDAPPQGDSIALHQPPQLNSAPLREHSYIDIYDQYDYSPLAPEFPHNSITQVPPTGPAYGIPGQNQNTSLESRSTNPFSTTQPFNQNLQQSAPQYPPASLQTRAATTPPQLQRPLTKAPSYPELPRSAMVRSDSGEPLPNGRGRLRQQASSPMLGGGVDPRKTTNARTPFLPERDHTGLKQAYGMSQQQQIQNQQHHHPHQPPHQQRQQQHLQQQQQGKHFYY